MRIVNPTAIIGENYAVEYLRKKGYEIIERNYRKKYGEIDIVALIRNKEENILVFVEVKTRKSTQYGSPLEGITRGKLRELIRTAQYYKLTHRYLPESMRVDAIGIRLNDDNNIDTIEHVLNITM